VTDWWSIETNWERFNLATGLGLTCGSCLTSLDVFNTPALDRALTLNPGDMVVGQIVQISPHCTLIG